MIRRFSLYLAAALLALRQFACPLQAATVDLVAGGGRGEDGSKAAEAKLITPFGIDLDKAGVLYFCEMDGNRVRRVSLEGTVDTVGGSYAKGDSGDGGPAKKAVLNGPHSIVVAPDGGILVADTWNNRIRRIDPVSGVIGPFAGAGKRGFGGDHGPAEKALFGAVYRLALDPRGKILYAADVENHRIRAIDLDTKTITTVAGNGQRGSPADGAVAIEAPLLDPRAVAADSKGNIYILERNGNCLREVDATGRIRTVAGNGKAGFSGDGGDARAAMLRGPKDICIDLEDNVIIADTDNHVIRKYIAAEGKIARVAGSGKRGAGGIGGAPEQLELNQPHGVHMDAGGVLYIADSFNHRILKIRP